MTDLEKLLIAFYIMDKDMQFQFIKQNIIDKYLKEIEEWAKNA